MTRFLARPIAIAVVALSTFAVQPSYAQSLPDLPIEDLLVIDAGRVFGASERSQPVTEAPTSVSFITAEDIERFGYRTLADILNGVRGMYVSDDRNFSLLGARGFGKPGDYNSRILLLVNGHRVNDNIFGQAEIGAEFGLDAAMFERVEIIRGPASSVYGDSAFFGVVNVITKSGANIDGASVTYQTGSYGTHMVRGTAGRRLSDTVDFAWSSTVERSDGVERLYFPAFDTPATNNGVAEGLDGQQFGQHYARLKVGSFTFAGSYGERTKQVPTASFNTLFNEQIDKEQTADRHGMADLEYGRTIGETRLALRGSYDRFTYDGYYPFDGTVFGIDKYVGHDSVVGARWTASGHVTRRLPLHQVLVFGGEFIDNIQQTQTSQFEPSLADPFTADRSSAQRAVFATDEIKVGRYVILNGGLRYDGYETFNRVTPRTALIVMPSAHQSFKYLYGRAFRAPSAYERHEFYFGSDVNNLRPESIDTHEFVWERYTGDWLRTSVSGYRYNADNLITLTGSGDPAAFLGVTYVNEGQVSAKGLELEAQMRLGRGIEAHMSYALQEATDRTTGRTLTNSPRQMLKGRASAPLFGRGSSLAIEALGIGSRQTIAGNRTDAATTIDVTAIKPLGKSLELVGNLRNLFDLDYAVPGGDQYVQDSIPQNGRTFRVGLRVKIK